MTPDQLVDQVRGNAGTQVQVTVQRPSTGETLNFDITRAKIKFPSVSWTMVPGTNIALIRFIAVRRRLIRRAVAARDAALAAGATSIVLDLRGNPGGYVDEAVKSASEFLHDKVVYIRETADGQQIPVNTDNSVPSTDVPLVLLIDNNTASSAEIMSGAIQDAGRAQLVGRDDVRHRYRAAALHAVRRLGHTPGHRTLADAQRRAHLRQGHHARRLGRAGTERRSHRAERPAAT